ncbi:ATP-binding protein [candidate division WOR-3 bacterium]|nr:ATP-binding protein [candidate division WOR-3 bacterium]
MIAVVEALNYRCLRYVPQELEPFQILVGPNASGKSTFLDVIGLMGDFLREGVVDAVRKRSRDFKPLVWMQQGNSFELAVEFKIPEKLPRRSDSYQAVRYELKLGLNGKKELAILGENLWLGPKKFPSKSPKKQKNLFPLPPEPKLEIVVPEGKHTSQDWRKIVSKNPSSGNDYFKSETTGWNNLFRLGPGKSALANLPEDEERFPVATWLKRSLMEGVQILVLNSEAMRKPSPPGTPKEFQPDGSSLPWVIQELERRNFERWLEHIRIAIPDLDTIETFERPEDRHLYLILVYKSGLKVPSWLVSDGTLRMLALTLLPYLDQEGRIYLIEEPENGIHPTAVELVFQSLSSVYKSQVLCASHSPVFLSLAEPKQLLCFAQDEKGATAIVSGSQHPRLKQWRKGTDLGKLLASGVLST